MAEILRSNEKQGSEAIVLAGTKLAKSIFCDEIIRNQKGSQMQYFHQKSAIENGFPVFFSMEMKYFLILHNCIICLH